MRSMRKLFLSGVVLASVVVLVGCPKKKKTDVVDGGGGGEAGAEQPAAADAAPAAAGPTAKNSADVARFPGETTLDKEAAKTLSLAIARTAPKGGDAIATLKAGAEVTKLASFQDAFLVTFADPKDATSRALLGWIGKEAFVAPVIADAGARDGGDAGPRDGGVDAAVTADAGKAPLKCAANHVAVVIGAEPVCKKKCATDGACAGGAKGSCGVAAAEKSGKAVHVCLNE